MITVLFLKSAPAINYKHTPMLLAADTACSMSMTRLSNSADYYSLLR